MLDQIVNYMVGADHPRHLAPVINQGKMAYSFTIHCLDCLCYRGIIRDGGRRGGHKLCYFSIQPDIRTYHLVEHIAGSKDSQKAEPVTDQHATDPGLLHLLENRTKTLMRVNR